MGLILLLIKNYTNNTCGCALFWTSTTMYHIKISIATKEWMDMVDEPSEREREREREEW